MGGKVAANLKSPELVLIILVLPLHVAIPEHHQHQHHQHEDHMRTILTKSKTCLLQVLSAPSLLQVQSPDRTSRLLRVIISVLGMTIKTIKMITSCMTNMIRMLVENLKERLEVGWSLLALCNRSTLSCKPKTRIIIIIIIIIVVVKMTIVISNL